MLPGSSGEFAWWGFNIVLLILIAWAKYDLSEIKNDGKQNRTMNEQNAKDLATRNGICEERHKRLDYEIANLEKRGKS